MFKKLVLLFISLFLISPIAFADDSSIVPVLCALYNFDFNYIYELKSSTESHVFAGNRLRTFYKTGDYIYELKSSTESHVFAGNRLRTFYIE